MPQPEILPPRVLTLEGGHNFREVGGYPTATGARMRGGLVWRSAGLDRLSAQDCGLIRELGIRTIADLRTEHERRTFPTPAELADSVSTLSWTSSEAEMSTSGGAGRAWGDLDRAALRSAIAGLYTRIADAHAGHLKDVYLAIADGASPILVHCTAGKDRTGLAIAILLELIGVTREWVLWDYEQTNRYLKKDMVNLESTIGVGGSADWMAALGPDGRDQLLQADQAYLLAALGSIEERFGSVERFALDVLSLPQCAIASLRGRLLDS